MRDVMCTRNPVIDGGADLRWPQMNQFDTNMKSCGIYVGYIYGLLNYIISGNKYAILRLIDYLIFFSFVAHLLKFETKSQFEGKFS